MSAQGSGQGNAATHAREYHAAGLRVFGLHGITPQGHCACENPHCKAVGKHPLASNWQHTPNWSEDQLDVMEMAGQFDTGFGVLCAGLLVVDVDARNGGLASYAKLVAAIPAVAGAGLIVETGSGGGSKHLYFKADISTPLAGHHTDYPGLDFKTSGYVVGPGSRHASGQLYQAVVGSADDIDDAPQELLALLARPDVHRAEVSGVMVDLSGSDLRDIVAVMQNDGSTDYETWIRVGMGLHYATSGGDDGFQLWEQWSAKSPKHDAAFMPAKWRSFGKSALASPVTLGTLVHYAQAAGWSLPVTFDAGDEFALEYGQPVSDDPIVVGSKQISGLPFDTSGVDLLRPPGLVGEVAAWIEGQSRRPREHLAVAAALQAVGNIAGLRYTCHNGDTTTNLFTFCVAGSRTGKEAIQQAIQQVHDLAGFGRCQHGAIKSEQEVIRNLIDHQPALYVVDEFGLFLAKVANAQRKGGAAYLDGVIAVLMSGYSKASGKMLLTGDMRRELAEKYKARAAKCQKALDEGPDQRKERELDQAIGALNRLDGGLERPFLSLIGFTTPVTFDQAVDEYAATNGFIGRALIFREKDTAPKLKAGFQKLPMGERLQNELMMMASGGEAGEWSERIEHYDERSRVFATPEALEMLGQCSDWLENLSDELKGRNGLESLSLGAYELIAKVALVLSVSTGVCTAENVRWAFALVRADIATKIRMVNITSAAADGDAISEIGNRILSALPDGGGVKGGAVGDGSCGQAWMGLAELRRKGAGRKIERDKALQETFAKTLDSLVEKGKVEMRVFTNPRNSLSAPKYRLTR